MWSRRIVKRDGGNNMNNMRSCWTVFGAGNLIFDILDAIEQNNGFTKEIVLNQPIQVDLSPYRIPIVSIKQFAPTQTSFPGGHYYTFGFINPDKEALLEELKSFNLKFSNLIHPRAYVAGLSILGQGNYIGPGAVIAPKTTIGDFNFINRNASIGHHTVLGNGNHVGPAATVSGRCQIGNKNFFGSGSTIIDGLSIGDNITLGAGGVLVKNTSEPGTYVGVPALKK